MWCAFPEHEDPLTPGPPHTGYVLVTVADAWGVGAMVAYTTTRPWIGGIPRGVRIFTLQQARATGQSKAFVLDLRRIAYIPVDSDWFPHLATPGHGIIGHASETLRGELEMVVKEIFGRHPDTVERLGPRWRR